MRREVGRSKRRTPLSRSNAPMTTDILLLLVLILLNGVFAMSEIAVVSSRRARLLQMAETSAGARRALALAAEPTRFLSSVQVGITCIGILSGAIGEASIAGRLRTVLERSPVVAPFAETLALGIMVILLGRLDCRGASFRAWRGPPDCAPRGWELVGGWRTGSRYRSPHPRCRGAAA